MFFYAFIIMVQEMGGACSRHGKDEKCMKIVVGKPEEKRPLGRPRRRWRDYRMEVGKVWWECAAWIYLAKDRDHWRAVVNTVMNLWVP
jgi:hypothetical protein